jgi:PAS domain S-box-containing protein
LKKNLSENKNASQTTEMLEQFPVGVIILDGEFHVSFANSIISQFIDDKTGDGEITLSSLLSKPDISLLKEGGFVERELKKVKTTDGGEIAIIIKAVPLLSSDKVTGAIIILEDIKLDGERSKPSDIRQIETLAPLFDVIHGMIVLVSPDGKVLFSCGNKSKMLTTSTSAALHQISDFFKPSIAEKITAVYRNCLLKKQSESIRFEMAAEDDENELEYFECIVTPYSGKDKKSQIVMLIRNITGLQQEIEVFKKENAELSQYQKFVQSSRFVVFGIDEKNRINFWNRPAENLFKLRHSEVFGKNISRILPEIGADILKQLSSLRESDKKETLTKLVTIGNSEQRYIQFKVASYEVEVNTKSLVFAASDVTEETEKQQQSDKNLFIYQVLFRDANIPSIILNTNGLFESTSKSFLDSFGYEESDLRNLYLMDIIDAGYINEKDITFRSLTSDSPQVVEIPFTTDKFKNRLYSVSLVPIKNKEMKIEKWGGVLTDISEIKALENEFFILRSVFELSNEGMAVELDGKYILANESFAKLYGYDSREEVIGVEAHSMMPDEDDKKGKESYHHYLHKNESPTRYEFLTERRDGTKFYAEVSLTFFEFDYRKYYVIVAHDVTERKRTQQVIKESEERYRNIAENIDDFFWTAERVNDKLKPIFYTASVEKITGYLPQEFLADEKRFFRLIYPDDLPDVISKLKRFYQNMYKRSEELEFRIINKYGNVVWIRNKINVLRDRKGKISKIYGLVSDVSMTKKAEQDLMSSTEGLQKLNETKDKFISIISHDLRTPFSSILGFTDLLLNEDDLTVDESRKYIEYIQESSRNMLSLVNSLLDWTRIQTGRIQFEPVHMELSELVQKIIMGMQGFALQKDIELINAVTTDYVLFIDQNLAMQAFNNLLSNALKFTPSGGAIRISAKQAEQPRYIQISVKDSGLGIKPENLDKIFRIDSKFTTEGTEGEKGTGLGLSLVKEIVEKHGGKIWVESEYGQGAEFIFTLPKASASILLVDDSSTDRILYAKILKNIAPDYEIITANNGQEALDMLLSKSPALIIIDHFMPVMTGIEFMQEYNKLTMKGKPPVVVLSGDLGKGEQIAFSELGVEYVFQKPVNIGSFKDAVEKSLKKLPQ